MPQLKAIQCAKAYQLILDGHDMRSQSLIEMGSIKLLGLFGYSNHDSAAASRAIAESYLSHAHVDDRGRKDPNALLEYFSIEVESRLQRASFLLGGKNSNSPHHKAFWWAHYLLFQRTRSAVELFKALFHLYKEVEDSYDRVTALRCVPYLILGDRLGHHRRNGTLAEVFWAKAYERFLSKSVPFY